MRRADTEDRIGERRGKRIYCVSGEWFYRTREGKRGPFASEMALRADMLSFIGTMEFLDENSSDLPGNVDAADVTFVEIESPRF